MLSFTYVYFFESSLFNGLWPIQTKNFFPSQAVRRPLLGPPSLPTAHGHWSGEQEGYSTISALGQDNA
jgi:hypothetical protein